MITHFLNKQHFFSDSASILLNFFMHRASNVASVLINTKRHHYNETDYIFSIFLSMSRPRSIYVVSL